MRFYALDAVPEIDAFVTTGSEGTRERLLVRQIEGELELALELPGHTLAPDGPGSLDGLCQVLEGVSHFLLVAHRAVRDRTTSQLELELQAEVDKFVFLALDGDEPATPRRRRQLMERLYHDVNYSAPEQTEEGDRYRTANRLALRFLRRLEERYLARARTAELQEALQTFYRLGPHDKVAYVAAA
jgi:hypothetical protein